MKRRLAIGILLGLLACGDDEPEHHLQCEQACDRVSSCGVRVYGFDDCEARCKRTPPVERSRFLRCASEDGYRCGSDADGSSCGDFVDCLRLGFGEAIVSRLWVYGSVGRLVEEPRKSGTCIKADCPVDACVVGELAVECDPKHCLPQEEVVDVSVCSQLGIDNMWFGVEQDLVFTYSEPMTCGAFLTSSIPFELFPGTSTFHVYAEGTLRPSDVLQRRPEYCWTLTSQSVSIEARDAKVVVDLPELHSEISEDSFPSCGIAPTE